ncbi:MAG: DnaJ domain-containing protein [Bryobacteraceae bacterium]
MSAPIAAFVDHYQVLGVEPKADTAAIHAAYTALATRHKEAGDKEAYDAVTGSYEVLADPEGRKAFDAVRLGSGSESVPLIFDPEDFFPKLAGDADRRLCLLCVLYNRRRQSPRVPGFPVRMLEKVVKITETELTIDMWFLKEKGYMTADDKSALMITVPGIEFLERERPTHEQIERFLVRQEIPRGPEAAVAQPHPDSHGDKRPKVGLLAGKEPLKINIPKSLSKLKPPTSPAH